MGRIFSRLGMMYAWASPHYLLYHMPIEQIFLYYDYGYEFEQHKSEMLSVDIIKKIRTGIFGEKEKQDKKPKKPPRVDEEPDREAFYHAYGDQIKRPEGG